jgi:hypothetical protein
MASQEGLDFKTLVILNMEQTGSRTGLLQVLWFPLPNLIPPTAPHSLSSLVAAIGNKMPDAPTAISIRPNK